MREKAQHSSGNCFLHPAYTSLREAGTLLDERPTLFNLLTGYNIRTLDNKEESND